MGQGKNILEGNDHLQEDLDLFYWLQYLMLLVSKLISASCIYFHLCLSTKDKRLSSELGASLLKEGRSLNINANMSTRQIKNIFPTYLLIFSVFFHEVFSFYPRYEISPPAPREVFFTWKHNCLTMQPSIIFINELLS